MTSELSPELEEVARDLLLLQAAFELLVRNDRDEMLFREKLLRVAAQRSEDVAEALRNHRRETLALITRPGPEGWGWSQARLAREVGVSRQRVQRLIQQMSQDDELVPEERRAAAVARWQEQAAERRRLAMEMASVVDGDGAKLREIVHRARQSREEPLETAVG